MLMSPTLVANLLAAASQISGLPIPAGAELPVVEFDSDVSVCAKVEADPACGIMGYYKDGTNVIHVNADADEVQSILPPQVRTDIPSIVVHELTHWLQEKNGHTGYDCPLVWVREYQAYWTQSKYIVEVEHKPDPEQSVPGYLCRPIEITP